MNLKNKYIYKVLLIEDDYEEAFLIEDILDIPDYKFHITHLTRLDKAIEVLRLETFDIVLLDLNLPGSDGAKSIKKICNVKNTVPIIGLTEMAQNPAAYYVIDCGVQNFMMKGNFTSNKLLASIKDAISRKQIELES